MRYELAILNFFCVDEFWIHRNKVKKFSKKTAGSGRIVLLAEKVRDNTKAMTKRSSRQKKLQKQTERTRLIEVENPLDIEWKIGTTGSGNMNRLSKKLNELRPICVDRVRKLDTKEWIGPKASKNE